MRLIDADRLETVLSETVMVIIRDPKTDKEACVMAVFDEFGKIIHNAPIIDAAPAKHGKWVVKGQDIFCSVCGEESAYTWNGSSKFSNYCPGCGTKMDGGKNDE